RRRADDPSPELRMPVVSIAASHRGQLADVLLEARAVDRAVLLFRRSEMPADLGAALMRRLGRTGGRRTDPRSIRILSVRRAHGHGRHDRAHAGHGTSDPAHAAPPSQKSKPFLRGSGPALYTAPPPLPFFRRQTT